MTATCFALPIIAGIHGAADPDGYDTVASAVMGGIFCPILTSIISPWTTKPFEKQSEVNPTLVRAANVLIGIKMVAATIVGVAGVATSAGSLIYSLKDASSSAGVEPFLGFTLPVLFGSLIFGASAIMNLTAFEQINNATKKTDNPSKPESKFEKNISNNNIR